MGNLGVVRTFAEGGSERESSGPREEREKEGLSDGCVCVCGPHTTNQSKQPTKFSF